MTTIKELSDLANQLNQLTAKAQKPRNTSAATVQYSTAGERVFTVEETSEIIKQQNQTP